MRQSINRLAALLGALLLSLAVIAGLQPVPPDAAPTPVATRLAATNVPPTPLPPSTPQPTPQPTALPRLQALPQDRTGLVLAVDEAGTLQIIAADGAQVRVLQPRESFRAAQWSPDGRRIAAMTRDRRLMVINPERTTVQQVLTPPDQVIGPVLDWVTPQALMFTWEQPDGGNAVTLWQNNELRTLGAGTAPAATANGETIAWIAPNGRSIQYMRGSELSQALLTSSQLYALVAQHFSGLGILNHPDAPPPRWSRDGAWLAFAVALQADDGRTRWLLAAVSADGAQVKSWPIPDAQRVYQIGWLPDQPRIMFTDEQGLAAVDINAAAIERLPAQHADVRYFAVAPSGDYLILALNNALSRIAIGRIDLPGFPIIPFGPPVQGYAQLDLCCRAGPP